MSKKNQLVILIVILTAVGVVTALTSAYFIKSKIAESLTEEETKNSEALAHHIASLLEKEIHTIQEKVQILARFPEIKDGDTATCNKKLAEVAPYLESQIDNITRINTDLTLDCAINIKALGFVVSPDNAIAIAMQNQEPAPALGYSSYSPVSQQEVLYLNLPVYKSDGAYGGIIGGVIYLNYIADKYLTHVTLGEESSITLIDDNGTFLYHPTPEYIGKNMDSPELAAFTSGGPALRDTYKGMVEDTAANQGGTRRFIDHDKEILAVYAPANVFPGRKWTVVITMPVATILANIGENRELGGLNLFLTILSGVLLLFILFSALVLFVVIKELFSPLRKIGDFTQKVGQGNFAEALNRDLLSADNEFGQLARSLQQMAKSLQESYGGLESKVQERTEALDKKITELERLNNLMVGRELKMAEMKKEIADLEKKL